MYIYGNYRKIKTGVPLFGPPCISLKACLPRFRSGFEQKNVGRQVADLLKPVADRVSDICLRKTGDVVLISKFWSLVLF